ncbi:hypothetical protein QTO34_007041 [Cnephaeus nilssonii]|uniref:KRAB domain-containing protein n=1 Tax=Cnephaeus nilssonii TaxID=3371016 RepID=A0AA40HK92_CNENI|nr:hypothetical protein QTO34_007041 [Eptesicus nilssonii]
MAFEDVVVNFTPEEWALLDPSQKNSIEINFSLIPNFDLSKKTSGVKPWEYSVCAKVFMHHSSPNMHMRCQTGHEP